LNQELSKETANQIHQVKMWGNPTISSSEH